MILRHVLSVSLCMSLLAWMQTSNGSDDLAIQVDAFSEVLEQPLRTHLVKKGYTPRNAAIAADSLLDTYAHCLAGTARTDMDSEPEATSFRLGDSVVLAYKSLCLTDFLDDVAGLP